MYLIPILCEMSFIYNAKSGARKLQEWTQLLKGHWGGPFSGHVMGQLAQWLVNRKEKIEFTQSEDTHMHTHCKNTHSLHDRVAGNMCLFQSLLASGSRLPPSP